MTAHLRIVLVEPREAGNVGAVARVMKNFGFDDLTIVGDKPPDFHPIADWWASGASELVESARCVPTLHAAVADTHLTIATTSARGRSAQEELRPRAVAKLFSQLEEGQTLALLFGRENHGLTREELRLAQLLAVVPTSPEFPTMNLAQSVAVFCYEISQGLRAELPGSRKLASAALVERLHERTQALLREVGFLDPCNPDRIYDDIRKIAGRAGLDDREVTILLGILRQLEWRRGS